MQEVLDRSVRCLCCDKLVMISSKAWEKCEAPYAVCKPCSTSVTPRLAKVLYLMRSQIASLYEDVASIKKNITSLYSAQKDVEQALLES